MRPGQHNNNNNNKNRGRGRNRNRHSGGGGSNYSGSGGGSPGNRVFESNGPDVKLRGTAQTIADKYMQLGRDAQSSGDTVMVESYYQHAEHYYRLWLANQPAGQPINFPRRPGDEEYEDENSADQAGDQSDAGENDDALAAEGEGAETNEGSSDEGEVANDRQPRFNNNREGGRNNNRQRWPRRGERNQEQRQQEQGDRPQRSDVTADVVADAPEAEAVVERVARAPAPVSTSAAETAGDWEAPSFLRRPVPAVVDTDEPEVAVVRTPRPRGRRPRFGEDMPAPVEVVVDDAD